MDGITEHITNSALCGNLYYLALTCDSVFIGGFYLDKDITPRFIEDNLVQIFYVSAVSDESTANLLNISLYKDNDNKLHSMFKNSVQFSKSDRDGGIMQFISDKFKLPIPSKFILDKKGSIPLVVRISDLEDVNAFTKQIVDVVIVDNYYTCIVKIRYNNDNFFMCGSQIGFHYLDNENITHLVHTIIERMEDYMGLYGLEDNSINYIAMNFRKLDE